MKTRTIVSLTIAALFIATSISVGATTSNRIAEKYMNQKEVQTEVRTGEKVITEENVETMSVLYRDRLKDDNPDCEQDQTRDRDRLHD